MVYRLYTATYDRLRSKFYWLFLALKLLAGIGVGWLYTYYYTSGDTFSFYDSGNKLADLARSDASAYFDFLYSSNSELLDSSMTWTPNLVMVKLTSVFCLITGDSYWLIATYFSVLSFSGLWLLYVTLTSKFQNNHLAIATGLFLVPSFVFWSSGLLKESLAIAGIAYVVNSFFKFISFRRVSWVNVLISALCLLLVWKLKYFYAGVLVVTLISGGAGILISKKMPVLHPSKPVLITAVVFAGLLLSATSTHPNFYLSRIVAVIVDNHDAIVMKTGGPVIQFFDLRPTISSVVVNSPLALFSGLFRPIGWEGGSFISLGVGLENLVLLLLTGMALWNCKGSDSKFHSILFISWILYVLVLATLLALSTPNFGTLTRFKVAYLPVLYIFVLYNNKYVKSLSNRLFN